MPRNTPSALIKILTGVVFCLAIASCGGGGGGGDERRTRDTALRIIHGSVDAAPVQVTLSDEQSLVAAFAEATSYQRVDEGEILLSVERNNSPGVSIGTVSAALEKETEYTIFVNREARNGDIRATLIDEPVLQPEVGFARARLFHGLFNEGRLKLRVGETVSEEIREGEASDYISIPMGPQVIEVLDDRGSRLSRQEVLVEDQSELSVLISGDEGISYSVTRVFVDFD